MEAGNSSFVKKFVFKKAAAMNVRKAESSDARTLFEFVLKLDREEASVRCPIMSVEDVLAAGFGADPLFEAFIAESPDGTALGAVSYYRGYSGWHAKPVAVVHMLFIDEDARGQGVGRSLMAAVAEVAVERHWARVELRVEEGRPAVRFYEAIGMRNCNEHHYLLEGRPLANLAGKGAEKAG
jgi:GNAT superfamily N-acetyltransferase